MFFQHKNKIKKHQNLLEPSNMKDTIITIIQTVIIIFGWYESREPLTQNWSSGNETIDKLIKDAQLKATCNNNKYLQWIQYGDLKDIEKIFEGGSATIYKATWVDGGISVALKKLD